MEAVVKKVKEVLMPILIEEGLELVDIEFKPSGKRWLLRVYIEKDGGVTISDCERVSRELGTILDVEDLIEHPYTLEVSSPGLTRPLKKIDDFKRNKGRLCRIITRRPFDDRHEFTGEIVAITDDKITISRGELDVVTIPISDIKKAKLEFNF